MKKIFLYIFSFLLCLNSQAAGKNYVYKLALSDDNKTPFRQSDPTTFKKLIFIKEATFGGVRKVHKYSDVRKNKTKNFKSFNFIAEYEDNITVKLFIESDPDYDKKYKTFERIEKRALYFAKMYGRMPHFLKINNKKIYVHESRGKDDSTWWAEPEKKAFHINESLCERNGSSLCLATMIHELAHVLQMGQKGIKLKISSKWRKVMKLDNKKYCSKYAKKNLNEDFAESILCWIGVRFKADRIKKDNIAKINEFIPNRLKFFDEMNFNMYPY